VSSISEPVLDRVTGAVEVDLEYIPRAWAIEVHGQLQRHRFSVVVAHRGAGKSYLAAYTLADAALRDGSGRGRYLFVSPFLKQARDVVWEYLKRAVRDVPGVVFQESLLQVRLPNGSWISLYGADNPDALRGMHPNGIVMDEVADMKPPVWGEIVRPMLTTHQAWALFIGTPKGINLFSQLYYAALADPLWYGGMFDVYGTGALSPAEIDLAKKTMTARQFDQELMCNFSAGSDRTLIPLDLAKGCSDRHLREEQYSWAPRLLGVDAARYGDDRTAIVRRQGLVMFRPTVTKGLDTAENIALIVREAESWKPHAIFVDIGGNAGVYDGIKRLRWPVHGVDFGAAPVDKRYANKRAEMWIAMRDWLASGAAIPDDQAVLADLCSTEFDYRNTRGKFQLESKEDMRARSMPSPDIADALACTFAFPIAPPGMVFAERKNARSNDYDPLSERYR